MDRHPQRTNRTRVAVWTVFTVLFLVACGETAGSGQDDSVPDVGLDTSEPIQQVDEPTRIDFWMMPVAGDDRDLLTSYVDDFNTSQSDVVVDLTILEWSDGREQIKQAVAAGTGPDVFFMGTGLDLDYLQAGALAPLSELGFTEEDLASFLPIIEANAYEGELYAVPLYWQTSVLFYNADILADYGFDGPPTTWDELKSMATHISQESAARGTPIAGYQHKGMDDHLNAINYTWQTFQHQAGGRMLSDDMSTSTQLSEEGLLALEYMRSFVEDGTSPIGLSAFGGFVDEEVAMYIFLQHESGQVVESGLQANWRLAPVPAGPVNGGSMLTGHSLAARADTAYPEAVGAFMKWMSSPQQSERYMDFYGIFPHDIERVDPEVRERIEARMADDSNWEAVFEQLRRNVPQPLLEYRYAYSARWEAQKQNIVAALSGQLELEQALRNIDDEVNQALASLRSQS